MKLKKEICHLCKKELTKVGRHKKLLINHDVKGGPPTFTCKFCVVGEVKKNKKKNRGKDC